jgi:hypothetical protein
MNFTVFLNSRGRAKQLKNFVDKLVLYTAFPELTELIITGDDDDTETLNLFKKLETSCPLKFKAIIGPRPASLCASFNNMARQAQGKYLLVMNDDAEMTTDRWDEIALRYIADFQNSNNYLDNVIYGETADSSVDKPAGKRYASFPIISKEAVDALGFFMHDSFVGLGGDSAIYRVYERVGRVVPMPEIVIDHIYHNTIFNVINPDQTAVEMRANSHKNNLNPFEFDIEADVTKLHLYILFKYVKP